MKSLIIAFSVISLSLVICHPVNGQRTSSSEKKYAKYVDGILKTYDADKDGSLSKGEIQNMRRPPKDADVDNDGSVSRAELLFSITGKIPVTVDEGNRHEVYAKHLIRLYDKDKNGMISESENARIRIRMEPRFDLNGDGEFSLEEIIKMVSKPSAPKVSSVSVSNEHSPKEKFQEMAATQSFMIANGAFSFAQNVLQKNDKDNNRRLEGEEISNIQWMSPSWKAADKNKDRALSQEELVSRYRGIFAYRAKKLETLEAAMENGAKILITQERSGKKGQSAQSARSKSSYKAKSKAEPKRKPTENSKNPTINVDLFLIRLPQNTDANAVSRAMSKMRESDSESLAETVADFKKSAGEASVELLCLTTVDGGSTNMTSGSQEHRTVGYSSRGQTRTRNLQPVDLGVVAKVKAVKTDGRFQIDLELSKSDLIESKPNENDEGEAFNLSSQIIEWSFESTLMVEPAKPTVVASSSKGQNWILAVSAY